MRGYVARLKKAGVRTWLDDDNVRFGGMLRKSLQTAIAGSDTLVLFWSKEAHASRWVNAELLTAFHLNRFVIPCVLDDTPLPQFLQNAAYMDRKRDKARLTDKLADAIRTAPRKRNEVAPLLAAESPALQQTIATIADAQRKEMSALENRELDQAAAIHAKVGKDVESAEQTFKYERMVMNLSGYHRKNDYMIRHWDAVQAGQLVPDPILASAERCFFDSLCIDPWEVSALNGLGSILMFERELDAAEFFQRRAIKIAHDEGYVYEEAKQDLAAVLYHKKQARTRATRTW